MSDHQTRIYETRRGHKWLIACTVCGQLPVPQDYEVDAQAIADRHQEIGGFERR